MTIPMTAQERYEAYLTIQALRGLPADPRVEWRLTDADCVFLRVNGISCEGTERLRDARS
jgi:hypothetical protein